MRYFDRVDIELVKSAPRGWSEHDWEDFKNAEQCIYNARNRGGHLRGPFSTKLQILIRTAHRAYQASGLESPWGADYERTEKYAGALEVGILWPQVPVPAAAPAPTPPPLECACPKCGFVPHDAAESPLDIDNLVDRKVMLSMRKEARLILGILKDRGGFGKTDEIAEPMRLLHDKPRDRTNLVIGAMFKVGILERPERAVYRIPEAAR